MPAGAASAEGAGEDPYLQPLGIAVIGTLLISVLLSLIATPVAYHLMIRFHERFLIQPSGRQPPQ